MQQNTDFIAMYSWESHFRILQFERDFLETKELLGQKTQLKEKDQPQSGDGFEGKPDDRSRGLINPDDLDFSH